MLNLKVESYKDYLAQDGHIVITEKALESQLGEKNVKWILSQNFLKQLEKGDVNNLVISFPYGEEAECEDFSVFWESDKYVFEPVAGHLEIWKSSTLPERVFKIAANDFVKMIALVNEYSHGCANFHLKDGFYFVGSRKLGNKDVGVLLFNGNPFLDLKRIEEQVKIAQQFNSSTSYIVLVFENESLPDVSSDLSFSLSRMRSNLFVEPRAYKQCGVLSQDIVKNIKYPVLIDHEAEFFYILGKKITKRAGTNLYQYLRDFVLYTQNSSLSYLQFCQTYCNTDASGNVVGEPSKLIGERKKAIIDNLKAECSEGTDEYQFAFQGLFSYSNGYLKSFFKKDDVFEWPR